ncbi:LytTR family transcriptional regulator DNA-binding domain-containing protein [Metasolibacillus meyeri]|uniref:LytTR family transcriptional regulator DNA-binding domain-containing protein n=1 Tax=Metasolibacillus meyeri TaxID=1071052 RepID=UPI000D30EF32|nr:LytTR family transcriptional regulator DNA-binding domain-containing protein [Metasolibacillus meyeri]
MQTTTIDIPAYVESGNIICPPLTIPHQPEFIMGIYTDQAKIQYLLKVLMKQPNSYVHLKNDNLYERLTVKEHVSFFKKLFNSSETVEALLQLVDLFDFKNMKATQLSNSNRQLLHYLKLYLTPASIIVVEEPLQNMEDFSKQMTVQLFEKLSQKMIILLSNNVEDLFISCHETNRLDAQGLCLLDVVGQDTATNDIITFSPMKIEKIPTKKNDKIILFNPPEIDYIESVEGNVSVYVAGEAYPCTLTLTELEQRLLPLGFFRCHRSYIVNLQKVREIITWTKNSYSLSIHTTTKTTVPLSKNKLTSLKELIGI